MTRKAFIIAGFKPRTESPYSVASNCSIEKDIVQMIKYLESDLGGNWIVGEDLELLIDKSKSFVTDSLSKTRSDYTFIYFTGHAEPIDGVEFIHLNTEREKLEVTLLRTDSSKQTIIIEACRNSNGEETLPPSPVDFDLPKLKNSGTSNTFNEHINNCDDCIILIFSTQKGYPASSDRKGGYFTQALLKSTVEWNKSKKPGAMLSISNAVKNSNHVLIAQKQKAEISPNSIPAAEFPFAISTTNK